MKNMRLCGLQLLLGLVAALLPTRPARASDWPAEGFELRAGYGISWSDDNITHIWLCCGDGSWENVTGKPGVGPLCEVAIDEQFLFAKNRGAKSVGAAEYDYSKALYTIIDLSHKTAYGPYSEDAFQRKIGELKIEKPVFWMTVREAYEEALRDGRVDRSYVGMWFGNRLLWAGFTTVLMSPVLLLLAVPVARKFKRWRFRRTLLLTWAALLAILFIYMSAPFVEEWFRLRSFW